MNLHPMTSLRARLVLLVFLALVPATALLVYTAYEERAIAVRSMEANARRLIGPASAHYYRLVEGTRQLLMVLARLPEIRRMNGPASQELFADLLARYPLYADMGLVDANGQAIAEGRPDSRRIDYRTRAVFQRAVSTRDFALGDYERNDEPGKSTLASAYPILGPNDRVRGVLYASFDLDWFNQFARQAELPPGSIMTVLDRHGTVLVHYPSAREHVGRSLTAGPSVDTIIRNGSGVTDVAGPDGVRRFYVYDRLGDPGLGTYMSIGVPHDIATAATDSILMRNLAILWLAGIAVILGVWVWSEWRIVARLRALADAARRLSRGEWHARTGLAATPDEIGDLATAFDNMARSIEAAQERITRSEEEKKRFHREVIEKITQDKLHLVEPDEIPVEGEPVLHLPLEKPLDDHELRRRLKAIVIEAGMPRESINDLMLAAGEAATNAIKHANGGECTVYHMPDRIIVRISDHGVGILDENLPAMLLQPGFSTKVSLGMGYTLMIRLVDRVWLATGPAGTTIQLEKWIDPAQSPVPSNVAMWERI